MSTRLPIAGARSPVRHDSARAARRARIGASTHALFTLLERLARGAIVVHLHDGTSRRFGTAAPGEPAAELPLRDGRVARDVLVGGDVAFAQAWIDGRWDTPDLARLLTVIARNQRALDAAFYGRWWRQAISRLRHALRANTRRGAARNIVAHYDLGNDFYALWLDETMSYSSALWDKESARPETAAQFAKYDRILAELALPPGSHILEIGSGWGAFAERAARAGHRVSGISLSPAQTSHARERLARAGLASCAQVAIRDYRDVRGRYDGIASIEMFEAVGQRFWPDYFRVLRDSLVPGGRAVVQTITIDNARFERYRTQSDFVQQHIFPGGMLASPSRIAALAHDAGFAIERVHRFGEDYARTLRGWLARFEARVDDVRRMGFDSRFVRCWRYYLAYCVAGFESGTTDVAQYTLQRVEPESCSAGVDRR